jgi:DNA-binding transcriptional regulator YiaG
VNKQEFSDFLRQINLSKREFSEMANISYATVNNWSDESRPVPPWVKSWLHNYVKAKAGEEIIDIVKAFMEREGGS